jgi:hypothetical protein
VNFALKEVPPTGPFVLSHTVFTVVSATVGSSPHFASKAGDAIIVIVAIHGTKTVRNVSDSENDSFASSWNESSGTAVGIAVWIATDVRGGSGVVVTVEGSASHDASYVTLVVDVSGVFTNPLVSAPSLNSSEGKFTKSLSGSVLAGANNLVLAGFAARGSVNFTPTGIGTLLDARVAFLTNYVTSGADAEFFATGPGTVTISAMMNLSQPWAEVVLALSGPG